LIGFSGVLELLALLAWAAVLWKGLVGSRIETHDGTPRSVTVGDAR